MQEQEICWISASDLAAAVRMKKLSPVEIVKHILKRIATINPEVNAYVTLTEELALAEANLVTLNFNLYPSELIDKHYMRRLQHGFPDEGPLQSAFKRHQSQLGHAHAPGVQWHYLDTRPVRSTY